jgi:ABC-type phosphate/phosphonate transport system substrate-binding protein
MNLPRHFFSSLAGKKPFFSSTHVTGSHMQSCEAVTNDVVDAAAIDCVTFALLQRYRPALVKRLRIINETASTPTPPFVTGRRTRMMDVKTMKTALDDYFHSPRSAAAREALLLEGIAICDESVYQVVMDLGNAAIKAGYPHLK